VASYLTSVGKLEKKVEQPVGEKLVANLVLQADFVTLNDLVGVLRSPPHNNPVNNEFISIEYNQKGGKKAYYTNPQLFLKKK